MRFFPALFAIALLASACEEQRKDGDIPVPYERSTPADHPVAIGVVDGRDIAPTNMSINRGTEAEKAMLGFFKPRGDLESHRLPQQIDWTADPFRDDNWRFQLNALRSIDPLIVGFEKTGRPEYLEKALDVSLQWIEANPQAPSGRPYRKKLSMDWQDMATGLRALRLAYLHQELRQGSFEATESDRQLLLQGLTLHADVLSRPDFFNPGNHGIFVAHGLMAACRELATDPACEKGRAYARDRIGALILQQFNEDGGHSEHSPGYHAFALLSFERFLKTGWYELSGAPARRLDKARDVYGWLADANGQFPNVGDSERKTNPKASSVFPERPGCATERAGEDPSCFGFTHLSATGYTVIRTAPNVPTSVRSSIFFTCGRHSRGHKHDDELSFEWMENGAYVVVDGGKYFYGRSPLRLHMLSREAHSTLQVRSQRRRDAWPGACTEEAELEGEVYTTSGTYRPNDRVTHARSLSYELGRKLSVRDVVQQSGERRSFELRWLLGPDFSLRKKEGPVWSLRRSGKAFGEVDLDPRCTWRVMRGRNKENPEAGWYSDRYAEIEPIEVLSGTCPSTVEELTTTFLNF